MLRKPAARLRFTQDGKRIGVILNEAKDLLDLTANYMGFRDGPKRNRVVHQFWNMPRLPVYVVPSFRVRAVYFAEIQHSAP